MLLFRFILSLMGYLPNLIFRQDGAPRYHANIACNFLAEKIGTHFNGTRQPTSPSMRATDLSLLKFFFCSSVVNSKVLDLFT